MGRLIAGVAVIGIILSIACSGYANVLFQDDFNDNSFDTAKWGTEVYSNNGGQVSTVTEAGGKLDFKLWGGNPGGSIYAYSKGVASSTGWSQIDFTGKWQQTGYRNTAGAGIIIYNAADLNKYYYVDYSPYFQQINFYDSGTKVGSTQSRARGLPEQQFSLVFTPTGWSFIDGSTTYINNAASTSFAGATSFKIKIGGGDYWYYSDNNEHTYFDSILLKDNLTQPAVPEPASMALLGMGLFGLLGLKRKKGGV